MNRIVREHYPVAELPENLREGFAPGEVVRVIVEPQQVSRVLAPSKKPFLLEDLFAQSRPSFATPRDITEHLDAMRDEWDERR